MQKLARKIHMTSHEKVVFEFLSQRGDKTYRLDYDLDDRSVVFDLGGYEGQWASDIYAKYCANIHIFEPVPRFAADIASRFKRNPKIIVYPFGLSDRTQQIQITVDDNKSTSFKKGKVTTAADLVAARQFFSSSKVTAIDLMKINIEGGEYDLLDHLLAEEMAPRIRNFQIQFHEFVPDAPARMRSIQQRLSRTHTLSYQFPFVWENWVRR